MSLDYKLTGRNICGIDEYSYDGVRFLFKPGNGKLIASFSAFTARGTEQKYNYLKDFNDSEFSILGFLDEDLPRSDPRGTYYLGREANGDYLKKIDAIVYDKSFTQRINEKDIWLIGSSKGATGALLLCFMFGYVNVFVNAPQYRIASYIKKRSEDI